MLVLLGLQGCLRRRLPSPLLRCRRLLLMLLRWPLGASRRRGWWGCHRDGDLGWWREGPTLGEEGGQQLLDAAAAAVGVRGQEEAAVGKRLRGQERRRRGHGMIRPRLHSGSGGRAEEGAGVLGELGALLCHQLPQLRLALGVGEGRRGRLLLVQQ